MQTKYFPENPYYELFICMLVKFRVEKLSPEILEELGEAQEEVLIILSAIRAIKKNPKYFYYHPYIASLFGYDSFPSLVRIIAVQHKSLIENNKEQFDPILIEKLTQPTYDDNDKALSQIFFAAAGRRVAPDSISAGLSVESIHAQISVRLPVYLLKLVQEIRKAEPTWHATLWSLHYLAVIYGNNEIFSHLLNGGANPGPNFIFWAAKQGLIEIIKLVLERDSSLLNRINLRGNTLSHFCFSEEMNFEKDYLALAKLLFGKYSDSPSKLNHLGETPLKVLHESLKKKYDGQKIAQDLFEKVVAICKEKNSIKNQVKVIEKYEQTDFIFLRIILRSILFVMLSLVVIPNFFDFSMRSMFVLVSLPVMVYACRIYEKRVMQSFELLYLRNAVQTDEQENALVDEKDRLHTEDEQAEPAADLTHSPSLTQTSDVKKEDDNIESVFGNTQRLFASVPGKPSDEFAHCQKKANQTDDDVRHNSERSLKLI